MAENTRRVHRRSADQSNRTVDVSKEKADFKNEPDEFTVIAAIVLYISFGVLLTIGSYQWVVTKLYSYFKISYAGYAALLITIFLLAELWALYIQIPGIRGYGEVVGEIGESMRKWAGIVCMAFLLINIVLYFDSSITEWYKTTLARGLYSISGLAQNTLDERLRIKNEIVEKEGATAKDFAERGSLYLEIGRVKTKQEDGYEYILPNATTAECFRDAVINYNDAIKIVDDNPEYYFQRGNAYYESIPAKYDDARKDFEKAIELDETNEEYYFGAAKAWYQIGDDGENEAYENALNYIDKAIKLHLEISGEDANEDGDGKDEGAIPDTQLAEYYYYEGLIYKTGENPDWENVAGNMEQAVRYDEKNAQYLSEQGEAYYRLGTNEYLQEAEEVFDKAIELYKESSEYDKEAVNIAWKAFTIENEGEEKAEEALELYDESVGLKPDYPFVYWQMIGIYKTEGNIGSVYDVYSTAIRNCVDNGEFYYGCGVEHYDNKNEPGIDRNKSCTHTIQDMEKALEKNYFDVKECYWYIASSYYCMDKYRAAYDNYQNAINNGYAEEDVKEYMEYCQSMIDGQ